ncbi:Putative type IV fimbrial biogenesis protein PilY1 [gamma proteobacterium HdN1]|nr:Putative type IV fimbrial biogenesis protein PilY1 [gamma proteobacterium HdN1]
MKSILLHSVGIRAGIGGFAALAMSTMGYAITLDPAQSPLILTESVAPNLLLTLDDSGSMRWAFVPDAINNTWGTRRSKSAFFNPMYYNPAVTYPVPVKYNADGTRASTQYSTSFEAAYNNGYDTARGSVNLANSYRVTWAYDLLSGTSNYGYNSTSNRYATNPSADFAGGTLSSTSTQGSPQAGTYSGNIASLSKGSGGEYTISGTVVKIIHKSGTSSCSATFKYGSGIVDSETTEEDVPNPGETTVTTESVKTTYPSDRTASCTYSKSQGYTVTAAVTRVTTTTVSVTRAAEEKSPVPAYYYVYDATLNNCSNSDGDDNCYRRVWVTATSGQLRSDDTPAGTDERKNFAVWYSFYRNRALSTLSAANIAFTGLPSSIRFAWQSLGNCTTIGSDSTYCNKNWIRKFNGQHAGSFFNWLPLIPFNQSTPLASALKRAGAFFSSSDPWAYNPNPLAANGAALATVQIPEYACRASYHIMMTDGMWNGTTVEDVQPSSFRHDGTDATMPDGVGKYTQQRPFVAKYSDDTKNLGDLAFHYWGTDLRTNLANDVKPVIVAPNAANPAAQYWDPRNDPATWQHMTTYTVGLGLGKALNFAGLQWAGGTYAGQAYQNLLNGTKTWPKASADSDNNVYDLWHAAINSRGEFFSAESPDAIVQAFREIVSRISNRTTSAGAPGVVASIVEDQLTREVYETKFNSEDWSGDLTKFKINEDGIRVAIWNAQAQLEGRTYSSRNIKMFDADASGKLKDFTWGNLSDDQRAFLNQNYDTSSAPVDSRGESRVNYIRGDQSGESSGASSFRPRSGKLGDIVNSSPVIVGTPKFVPYLADLIDGGRDADGNSVYEAFRNAHRSELEGTETAPPRRQMVYVGGNDGMLHGFDASTGEERFAYVPSVAFENLARLTAQSYKGTGHRFFVDGTPVVSDVYYDNAWHTVLVGTMRAGGRALFALDVTDPENITLLWEKTFSDADFTNLGYTFAQPVIARLHTGEWAVVMGNGYGNQSSTNVDKASLMVIDVKTGDMVKELVVAGDAAKANGMSSPKLADNNSDGIADYAYAGDLQGNVWRFDLVTTSATPASPDPFKKSVVGTMLPSSFAVSYAGTPFYKTLDGRTSGAAPQPIMAPPSLVRHPTGKGYIVVFGTGRYFETVDGNVNTTAAQTLYGIWDRETKGQSTSARTSPKRINLQQQTIDKVTSDNPFADNSAVAGLRLISNNPVTWLDASGNTVKQGWFLDLKVGSTNAGEMMISPMATRGQLLLVSTITPNSDPCKEGVESWLYGIDPATGGRTKFSVFDLSDDKKVNVGDTYKENGVDTVVSAYKKSGSGGFTTNNGEIYTAPSQSSGMMYNAGPLSQGRQSWRTLPEEAVHVETEEEAP